MAVLVRYATGATLPYHLTAASAWEGYRVMVNGSKGRLELEVVENDHVARHSGTGTSTAALHGVEPAVESSRARLTLHPFWEPPEEIPLPCLQVGMAGPMPG